MARAHREIGYVELLRGLNDPRLPITIRPTRWDSVRGQIVYRGHRNGQPGEQDSTISRINSYFSADSATLSWVSYAHAKFIEAEARLILGDRAAAANFNAVFVQIRGEGDAYYHSNVEPWSPSRIAAMTSGRPPMADSGNPPPIALAIVIRSGATS